MTRILVAPEKVHGVVIVRKSMCHLPNSGGDVSCDVDEAGGPTVARALKLANGFVPSMVTSAATMTLPDEVDVLRLTVEQDPGPCCRLTVEQDPEPFGNCLVAQSSDATDEQVCDEFKDPIDVSSQAASAPHPANCARRLSSCCLTRRASRRDAMD